MTSTCPTAEVLISKYRQMQEAMVAADSQRLARLLEDEFILVHMTGYQQPREEWLAQIDNGRMQYGSSVEEDVRVTRLNDARASLRGRSRVRAVIWGAEGLWPLQLDVEFSNHAGEWLMRRASASTY